MRSASAESRSNIPSQPCSAAIVVACTALHANVERRSRFRVRMDVELQNQACHLLYGADTFLRVEAAWDGRPVTRICSVPRPCELS